MVGICHGGNVPVSHDDDDEEEDGDDDNDDDDEDDDHGQSDQSEADQANLHVVHHLEDVKNFVRKWGQ